MLTIVVTLLGWRVSDSQESPGVKDGEYTLLRIMRVW